MRVYTGGTFDLFHAGHINLLMRCRHFYSPSDGNEVVVSLNTDEFILDYKGKLPVMSYEEREAALLACRYVDRVIPNIGGADSRQAIELVKPDYIVIGSDWATKNYYSQMGFTQAWLDERGIGLVYVPYSKGVSSSEIKNRIKRI